MFHVKQFMESTVNVLDKPMIYIKTLDFFLTQEEFSLVKNPEFGFLETRPVPEKLSQYYESEAYISHSDTKDTRKDKIYHWVRKYNLKYKFSKLSNPKPGMRLFDFGSGTGDFLHLAKKKGLEISGVEPNQKARELANSKLKVHTVFGDLADVEKKKFDFITLWHVLEHLPNLHEFLTQLKKMIAENGEILIAVPNYQSLDAKFYKEFWAAYDTPRHLWHFSPENMEKLLNHHGFKVEKKYPLWLDSFYISLLSEKYKKNKLGLPSAMIIGLYSNVAACFSKQYSSIIYKVKRNDF